MLRAVPSTSNGEPASFDGQFFLRLAEDPLVGPATARALDAPVLRARRIGLPVAGRLFALCAGSPQAGLLLAETASLLLLAGIAQLGARAGHLSPLTVLAVPLSLPFALSLELVTAELGCAALVLLAAHVAHPSSKKGALPATIGALAAACLFKEAGALAVAAFSLAAFLQGRRREGLLLLTALVPFAGWQLYLSMHLDGGTDLPALLQNLAAPGAGIARALSAHLSALLSGSPSPKAAGLLAATLWYVAATVLAVLLLRGGCTRGRFLALAGALLAVTLSYGGTAQAFNEVFNFGRQLFLLPVGLLIVLFEETSSLSPHMRHALTAWLAAGALLGLGWFLQEVISDHRTTQNNEERNMESLRQDKPGRVVGIDAGASLWKLALLPGESEALEMELFPAGTMKTIEEVRRRIGIWSPEQVHVTGGGAARIAAALEGMPVRQVSEFAAWARGAQVLAGRAGWSLPQRYLLVSLGTGTSVLEVDGASFQRIGGTALGGGTLLGLARLLCRTESFAEAVALAARGERGRVDLLVRDVYPEGGIALPPDLTAANFAKLASREPADLAHALMGLLGENIGITCTAVAQARSIDTLLFGGSALEDNPTLQEILRLTVQMGGREARILPDGAFCGAVGAAAFV